MRTILASVAVTLVVALFVIGLLLLIRRHNRQQSQRGRSGWARNDVIGLASLVSSVILGAASLGIALTLSASTDGPPEPEPRTPDPAPPSTPHASPTEALVQVDELDRLHEGSDVSLFSEVLGPPGYRRVITDGSKSREWGWADSDRYMVRAVVNDDDQVTSYSITSLSPDFRPRVPYLADLSGVDMRVGTVTFDEFEKATDPDLSPSGRETSGLAASGRWYFAEFYYVPNPLYRTFVTTYGFTGSGQSGNTNLDALDAFGTCDPQPCLGAVSDDSALHEARTAWPVTTFTVLGDVGKLGPEHELLVGEPTDDEIAAADRG